MIFLMSSEFKYLSFQNRLKAKKAVYPLYSGGEALPGRNCCFMEERDPVWILCSLPLGTVPPAFWPVVGSASVCALAESIADLTRVFYYWVLCI